MERKPGTWRLRVFTGSTMSGTPRQASRTFKGSKRQAELALAAFAVEVAGAPPTATHDGRITVAAFARQWLNSRITGIAPRTWRYYREVVEHQLIPAFGHLPLRKLTHFDLTGLYVRLLKDGGKRGRGLSAASVNKQTHKVVNMVFKAAVKAGHITVNPASLITAPRIEEKAPPVLNDTDKEVYLAAFAGHRLEAAATLLLACGLRRGELLALRWDRGAAAFEEGRLEIVESLVDIRLREPKPGESKTQLVLVPTKTRAGRRTVWIPPAAIEVLKRHRIRQQEECLRLGWGRPTFLFTNPETGGMWRPSRLSEAFAAVGAAHGLKLWPHLLRHTHLTDLLRDNVHPKIAQHRAGHSQIATTLGLYSHVMEGMQEAAIRSAEAVLRKARKES
jgi:integrase